MDEIVKFVHAQRERLAADEAWQDGYDPNDYAAYGAIHGAHDMLNELCAHFGLPQVD